MNNQVKKKVTCPKCKQSDRLERNVAISHVTETIGSGFMATLSIVRLVTSSSSPITALVTAIGSIALSTETGRQSGKVVGEQIEGSIGAEFRCCRCQIKF